MVKITFYDSIENHLLKYAVIASRYKNQWVFCKHRDRTTFEFPGGHREAGEDIVNTAKRELYEETGSIDYTLKQICPYSVRDFEETFGMLFYSEIRELGEMPPGFEIERLQMFGELPDHLTYPEIQPVLMDKVISFLSRESGNGSEKK